MITIIVLKEKNTYKKYLKNNNK